MRAQNHDQTLLVTNNNMDNASGSMESAADPARMLSKSSFCPEVPDLTDNNKAIAKFYVANHKSILNCGDSLICPGHRSKHKSNISPQTNSQRYVSKQWHPLYIKEKQTMRTKMNQGPTHKRQKGSKKKRKKKTLIFKQIGTPRSLVVHDTKFGDNHNIKLSFPGFLVTSGKKPPPSCKKPIDGSRHAAA